jgi:hypothetical protein
MVRRTETQRVVSQASSSSSGPSSRPRASSRSTPSMSLLGAAARAPARSWACSPSSCTCSSRTKSRRSQTDGRRRRPSSASDQLGRKKALWVGFLQLHLTRASADLLPPSLQVHPLGDPRRLNLGRVLRRQLEDLDRREAARRGRRRHAPGEWAGCCEALLKKR